MAGRWLNLPPLRVAAVAFMLATLLSSGVAVAAPMRGPDGEECVAFAYTADFGTNHYSLIQNGSLLVGSLVIAETDCGSFDLLADGVAMQGGDSVLSVEVPLHTRTISLVGSNWSVTWSNLTLMAGSDFSEALNLWSDEAPPGALYFTPAEIESREVWVAVGSSLILWVMVTALLSRAVSYWHETRFIEEVIS